MIMMRRRMVKVGPIEVAQEGLVAQESRMSRNNLTWPGGLLDELDLDSDEKPPFLDAVSHSLQSASLGPKTASLGWSMQGKQLEPSITPYSNPCMRDAKTAVRPPSSDAPLCTECNR
ncbi:hypothetical protein ACRALDRAFT_1092807 [Sodiomyces alcalophilus JCM 7366]|uniref:uncharacterized protein n=1 Tax=Sodiomyces alcalophilus JCM 7366 TaxID=591952 RepID=UPI0039B592FA